MITVPKSAFGDQAEGGEPVTPEVGDEVNLGEVVMRITGDKGDAYDCDVVSVNGAAVSDGGEDPKDAAPGNSSDLRAAMEKADES